MDEQFVQGVVGGVLNRHKGRTLDKKRIQTLMVEIAANIDLVSSAKGLAKDNPLSIEMWKGWKPTPVEEEGGPKLNQGHEQKREKEQGRNKDKREDRKAYKGRREIIPPPPKLD